MKQILLADDQSSIPDLHRMILAHREYEVLVAESSPETVDLFRRAGWSLLILDLHIEGFTVLEHLHTLQSTARIFMLTGADIETRRA